MTVERAGALDLVAAEMRRLHLWAVGEQFNNKAGLSKDDAARFADYLGTRLEESGALAAWAAEHNGTGDDVEAAFQACVSAFQALSRVSARTDEERDALAVAQTGLGAAVRAIRAYKAEAGLV